MDQTTVERALQVVRDLVKADGGDVELVGLDGSTVNLKLILDGVDCQECVMPRPVLEEITMGLIRQSVPDVTGVSISDPRES